MTTIIATKNRMIADSRVSVDSDNPKVEDQIYPGVKLYEKDDAVIGYCGSNDDGERFLKWYGSKKKKPNIMDKEFSALVLTKKGIYHYDAVLAGERILSEFYAIGSGGNAALACLFMGASPEAAMEIVFKVDKHSGPPIQIVRLKTNEI